MSVFGMSDLGAKDGEERKKGKKEMMIQLIGSPMKQQEIKKRKI